MRNAFALRGSVLLLSLATLPACDASLGSVSTSGGGSEGDETTTTGDGDGDGNGDGDPLACIGGQLCPTGTSCSNGLCETECSSDDDCAADRYCGLDGLCHATTVPSCSSDLDCAPTQTCANQICTTLGDCDLDNYLQDGCPSNAVCIEDFDRAGEGSCYPMAACAAEQSCPIGLEGAVCNTGQLPTKDEICLVGFCDVVTNCPDFWSCVRYDNSVLGVCSDGGFGSPCSQDLHCLSGSCVLLPGVGGGFCG